MTYLYYASQNNSNFCEYQMFYLANLTISNNQFPNYEFEFLEFWAIRASFASIVCLFAVEVFSQNNNISLFLFWKFRTRSSDIGRWVRGARHLSVEPLVAIPT